MSSAGRECNGGLRRRRDTGILPVNGHSLDASSPVSLRRTRGRPTLVPQARLGEAPRILTRESGDGARRLPTRRSRFSSGWLRDSLWSVAGLGDRDSMRRPNDAMPAPDYARHARPTHQKPGPAVPLRRLPPCPAVSSDRAPVGFGTAMRATRRSSRRYTGDPDAPMRRSMLNRVVVLRSVRDGPRSGGGGIGSRTRVRTRAATPSRRPTGGAT